VSATTTEERVRRMAAEELGLPEAELTADARLVEDLDVDPLAAMEFLMALQEEFNIVVCCEAQYIATIADATRHIEARLTE
jgi:acyl carrier protein